MRRLSLLTRDAVLGYSQPGNPKDVTQEDSTHRQRTCLIGICKDMMSSMDPSREAGLQDEVAGTSLVTRKFSFSIFCWKRLHKLKESKSMNIKDKPWLLHVGASGKDLLPNFYSRKGQYWRITCYATVAALTNVIIQIRHTVQSHVSTQ